MYSTKACRSGSRTIVDDSCEELLSMRREDSFVAKRVLREQAFLSRDLAEKC